MTPEQRYMFDLTGYLHLEKVLTGDELKNAQEATQRYRDTADEDLPAGFERDGKRHVHGFAFDKCLEALTMHPATWPIIMELTNGKPRLLSGTLQVDEPGKPSGGRLHWPVKITAGRAPGTRFVTAASTAMTSWFFLIWTTFCRETGDFSCCRDPTSQTSTVPNHSSTGDTSRTSCRRE